MADTKYSKAGCFATAFVVLIALAVAILMTCTVHIPANQVGVRTQLTSTGVEPKDHAPGFVLCIPGFHRVGLWDPTWTNAYQTLQIRGSDQSTTTVDISVLFRIKPGKCNEAAKHFKDYAHIEKLAKNMVMKYANEILAQMMTEEFYNAKVRNEKAVEVQKAIDSDMQPFGLEARRILLRNIIYDPRFEAQLLNKQLSGQRSSLEKAKGQLAAAQTVTELITKGAGAEVKRIEESKIQDMANLRADMERATAKITQDAKMKALGIVAKAESAKRQKLAQAEMLKANAAAAGTAALSKVYSRPGASFYFTRQAIEGMKLGDIEVNSSTFNPLDSEMLLKALGLNLRAMPPVPQSAPEVVPEQKSPGSLSEPMLSNDKTMP